MAQKVSDDYNAKCKLCNVSFSIKEGITAVQKHKTAIKHQNSEKSLRSTQTLSGFVTKMKPKEFEEVCVSEVCLTYHCVSHHLSYNSMDCNIKLTKNLFTDSQICQSIQCGRTKMEALAKNVLCPLSIEQHLKELNSKKFAIGSDASNKGNIKMFPIAIQYFTTNKGIVNFVLDFYEDANETSDAIHNRIIECLNEYNVNLMDVIAYSGDNASVNYGKHHSIYENLKISNNCIVKANCNCHVLHNTAKHALLQLPFDIENIILKIYSHFSISAKRVQSLKSCYELIDDEYEGMIRHVPTRWLTLYPAINRLIENIKPIKDYFVGIGDENWCILLRNSFGVKILME